MGIGQRIYVGDSDIIRWELRASNTLSHDGLGGADLNNFQALLGYSWGKGGKPVDSDGDGVPDRRDGCSDTPLGAVVDLEGCPLDSDGDGVSDGIDRCPDTPTGYPVDAHGCATDADGDGVPDGADACPGTPRGAVVDARGCAKDGDADDVPDGIDRCPDTPKGARVDSQGCPLDSDADGVFDGLDQCPGTPRGSKIGTDGCPVQAAVPPPFGPTEPMVVVYFESDKASLLPESIARLDRLVEGLEAWSDIRIEIAGHADATHSAEHNLDLSRRRGQAVLTYLVSMGIDASRVEVTAMGEGRPAADNDTIQGRAMNRRAVIRRVD